jgi:hypothetical protein
MHDNIYLLYLFAKLKRLFPVSALYPVAANFMSFPVTADLATLYCPVANNE